MSEEEKEKRKEAAFRENYYRFADFEVIEKDTYRFTLNHWMKDVLCKMLKEKKISFKTQKAHVEWGEVMFHIVVEGDIENFFDIRDEFAEHLLERRRKRTCP